MKARYCVMYSTYLLTQTKNNSFCIQKADIGRPRVKNILSGKSKYSEENPFFTVVYSQREVI